MPPHRTTKTVSVLQKGNQYTGIQIRVIVNLIVGVHEKELKNRQQATSRPFHHEFAWQAGYPWA